MPRPRTDPHKAALIQALSDAGHTKSEIARMTDTPLSTANYIANRKAFWATIDSKSPDFTKHRQLAKLELQAKSVQLAGRALEQVEKTLDNEGAYRSTLIYGILRDKERLDAGEPTAIIEHTGERSERLAAAEQKLQALLEQRRNEIDVTPEATGQTGNGQDPAKS